MPASVPPACEAAKKFLYDVASSPPASSKVFAATVRLPVTLSAPPESVRTPFVVFRSFVVTVPDAIVSVALFASSVAFSVFSKAIDGATRAPPSTVMVPFW